MKDMAWLLQNSEPVEEPEGHRCEPPVRVAKELGNVSPEMMRSLPAKAWVPDGNLRDVWRCDFVYEGGMPCDEVWEIYGYTPFPEWRRVGGLFSLWLVNRRIRKARERAERAS